MQFECMNITIHINKSENKIEVLHDHVLYEGALNNDFIYFLTNSEFTYIIHIGLLVIRANGVELPLYEVNEYLDKINSNSKYTAIIKKDKLIIGNMHECIDLPLLSLDYVNIVAVITHININDCNVNMQWLANIISRYEISSVKIKKANLLKIMEENIVIKSVRIIYVPRSMFDFDSIYKQFPNINIIYSKDAILKTNN